MYHWLLRIASEALASRCTGSCQKSFQRRIPLLPGPHTQRTHPVVTRSLTQLAAPARRDGTLNDSSRRSRPATPRCPALPGRSFSETFHSPSSESSSTNARSPLFEEFEFKFQNLQEIALILLHLAPPTQVKI